ncbi:hypothetical protein PybrP1_006026 [[Pythium] brassicae (nom. inval.)]|nr:hypothetical protein PybrP1_006026 [[Pythium] brassicae (nom. inval.)]
MLKSLVKDLAGTADICKTVSNLSKTLAAAYLLPGETLLFAFASPKEEFAFTNEALITVCGENATTTRKLVSRFDYREHQLSHVQFETTGRVDRDCEIKFQIGEYWMSIDVARKEEELVKTHYKALVVLAREQRGRRRNWDLCQSALNNSSDALRLNALDAPSSQTLTEHAEGTLGWLQSDFDRLNPRNYHSAIQAAVSGAAPASGSERHRHSYA